MDRREFLKAAAVSGAVLAGGRTALAQESKTCLPMKPDGPLKLWYSVQPHWYSDLPTMEARLERIYAEGFRAVENNGFKRMKREDQEKYGNKLRDLKMRHGIFVANRGVNEGAGLVDPKQRDAFLDEIRSSIEVAPIIDAKFVTITTGNEVPRMSRGRMMLNVIDGLKAAGDLLGKAGIIGVVEPLNLKRDHPGYFLSAPDESYAIMKAVNHPNIKILFDIYHQQVDHGNVIENIRQYWDEIAYFQFADVPGRHEPYTGEINYRNVFKAIYEMQQKTGQVWFVGAELGPIGGSATAGAQACLDRIKQADDFEV